MIPRFPHHRWVYQLCNCSSKHLFFLMRGSYWCKLNFYATMETRAFQRCFFQKVSDREVTQCSWSARHVGVCHRRFAWRWRGAFNISGILLQVSWQDDSIKRVFWFSFFLFQPTVQTEFAIRKNYEVTTYWCICWRQTSTCTPYRLYGDLAHYLMPTPIAADGFRILVLESYSDFGVT